MHQSRRKFIQTAGLLTAGSWIGLPALASCKQTNLSSLKELGFITNIIGKEIKEDWKGTLEKVAGMGFKYFESGEIYGNSLEDYKKFLKNINLTPLAAGSSMAQFLDEASFNELIMRGHDLNVKYIVCYWPWMSDALNLTTDEIKTAADNLNKIGEKCKSENFTFAWHNHDKEFKPVKEMIPYDYLLSNTDPAICKVEIDLYWIYKGNDEPLHYFEKYPGRFELIHMKDMDDTAERSFACVGDGIIDFPAILKKSRLAGMKHLIVEHDHPENGLECIQRSYDYIQSIL
jgi:sugar phosphate isomerase/epimerase